MSYPTDELLDFLEMLEAISSEGWNGPMCRLVYANARQLAQAQECELEQLTIAQMLRVVNNTRMQMNPQWSGNPTPEHGGTGA